MRAVILAAGVGSRLGNPFPKSLSVIPGGERILGRQIRILRQYGVREIFVVAGFKKELLMEEFPQVYFCYNPVYYLTNTAKSLLCALEGMDDDVIWTNGDVVFDDDVIGQIVKANGNVVMVDRSECGDEEVKYRTNEANEIVEISKNVVGGEGEAVGINRVSREDLPALVQALRECGDQDYFEKGLEILIDREVFFKSLDVSQYRCIEVDFEEDLSKARSMFADYQAPAGTVGGAIAF
jgi:choline kinase